MDSVNQADSSEEERNWLELPPDVTSLIFMKLGAIELLFTVQGVCSSWRKLCKEPQLWRSIDMRNPWHYFSNDDDFDIEKMARDAVYRSCGQLVEFSVEYYGTDELLQHIADQSSPLKCLRLVSCCLITDDGLMKVVERFPLLEELDLSYCSFSKEVVEAFGRSCPRLKYFRLNQGFRRPHIECDEDALAIANNMPELQHLFLLGNRLTDDGLHAILDSCTHLESLDLRKCFYVSLGGDLRKRCADRIKCLWLPNDPFGDSELDVRFEDDGSFDGSFDEEYPSGFSDIDFLSDDVYYEFSEGSELSDSEDFIF